MKINKITLEIGYTEAEKLQGKVGPILLVRDEHKQWSVREHGISPDMPDFPYAVDRGMYAGEIRLANMMQELIIHPWNGGQK